MATSQSASQGSVVVDDHNVTKRSQKRTVALEASSNLDPSSVPTAEQPAETKISSVNFESVLSGILKRLATLEDSEKKLLSDVDSLQKSEKQLLSNVEKLYKNEKTLLSRIDELEKLTETLQSDHKAHKDAENTF